ncbi:MAG: aminotransferase class I/II-fold pyridoxal phosphate-dependent enzyme [Candidatus Rokubacteria bacterium]|nr:aminotransferase class I/II-fold pyridoxal phosphate-dependent enzyme [Candidatus Rokubacteria bacterium]
MKEQETMRRHIARYVELTAGGERTRHFTAKQPAGMIKLDSGSPSFPTPAHIRAAAQRALDEGLTGYAPGQGDPEFLQAVCETVEREAGARYSPDDVFATSGATSGIYAVFTAFLDPGDEVILLDPTFSLYALVARQLGAVPVFVPHAADYHVDVDAVRAAVTPRTRLVMVNNPNNPTGVVYRRDELEALAKLCAERDLMFVADEAYEKILQPGCAHVPLLSFHDYRDHLILTHTFSKTYAMTGWRLGYVVAPPDLATLLFGVHRSITGPICTFVQRAGAAALRGSQDCVAEMRGEYRKRGSLMHRLALAIPGLHPLDPQGGFYLYARYDHALPARDVRARVWDAGVAIRSGTEFGDAGERHLRFSYSVDEVTIEKGMAVVADVFRQLG